MNSSFEQGEILIDDPDNNDPFDSDINELDDDIDDEIKSIKPGPLDGRLQKSDFLLSFSTIVLIFLVSAWSWQGGAGRDLSVSGLRVFEYGEWWRLISAMFVHADIGHFLSNAPYILFFGALLSKYFGWRAFPVIAIFVGALTNLGTIYFYQPQQRLVGASGMLYAVVAMWLTLYLRFEMRHGIGWRLIRVVAFGLIVLFPTVFRPEVSYLAHGLGFGIGVLVILVSWPLWSPIGFHSSSADSFPDDDPRYRNGSLLN